jgi:signal transduction histidine kinase
MASIPPRRPLGPPGLGFHAFAVSSTLILLAVLLGARAWSVGRLHEREVSSLVLHELRTQALLERITVASEEKRLAERKLRITRDPAYAAVAGRHATALADALGELRDELSAVYPELAHEVPSPDRPSVGTLAFLRDEIALRHRRKLERAADEARGLSRMIAVAAALSVGATAWLLVLFSHGLIRPLRLLTEATARVRGGDLAHRLPRVHGVAELRDLADSFNSMAARLESLDRAKGEFLATISHEIKNPLAALKEGLSLIVSHGESLPVTSRAKAGAACLIASKRLETMINNLLSHSKMETGLYRFDFTPKNLAGAIQIALDEVRPLAERRGMQIHYVGPSELQASFNWDGMVQVFENLLMNAIKYGEPSTAIEITARAALAGGTPIPQISVAVLNSGGTIADVDLGRVFERFYRGSNSGQQQGMGLGLHVVRKIIEAHRGAVTAESANGRTRFELRIPGRYETEAEGPA